MATVRERAAGLLRERLGYDIVPAREVARLREMEGDFHAFVDDAEELGWQSLDYFSGRPQELMPWRRRRLAQKSRYALVHDPIGKAEATHLRNFAFGRGIPMPEAKDESVQKILEEAWTDAVNEQVATGFEAQQKLSNDLLAGGNLYPAAYSSGGRVRLGMIQQDRVERIITDPENDERPLWYLVRDYEVEWDFEQDRAKLPDGTKDGLPKVKYWPHWRNAEDYLDENSGADHPSDEKTGPGLVYHVRINRVGETQFGTPPWAASLRFMSAMNDFLESRVTMAQASAQFIAKRVRKDSPEGLIKAARTVTNVAGELARSSFERFRDPADQRNVPSGPGSWWVENEADRLESMKLDSGAGNATQDSQIIRSPLSAASTFGQHYLGDASSTTLAGGTTLELPILMTVGSWQETFEQFYRWFCDLTIQEAIRAGRLGGAVDPNADDGTPLEELRLSEADGAAEMARRTGRDLSYSFQMPYPGRRNLPDVTAAVTQPFVAVSGLDRNEPMLKAALTFLFTHGWELEDPAGTAEDVLKEQTKLWKKADEQATQIAAGADGQGGLNPPPGTGQGGATQPGDQQSQYGEKTRSQPASPDMATMAADEPYLDPSLARLGADLLSQVDGLYEPVLAAAGSNGASGSS